MTTEVTSEPTFGVLVFFGTAGFTHASIPDGIAAVTELGRDGGFTVTATDDPGVFTVFGLDPFSVVVFLNTTGDVLDPSQQAAFEGFIVREGGFVGVHSAADTEYDWPWYGELVGAYFSDHPAPQTATMRVVDTDHPATSSLPSSFERFDEWYNFRAPLSPDVTVLIELDETSYEGGTMGDAHPIAWAREIHGGRAFYTGFGHTTESFTEPLVRAHLLGAIRWAANRA